MSTNLTYVIFKEIQFDKNKGVIMILGFSGYPDAGFASSNAINYIIKKFNAEEIGYFNAEEFIEYSLSRPYVSIIRGLIQYLDYPHIKIHFANFQNKQFLFLSGPEPHMKWIKFIDSVIELANKFNVKQIYTFGSYISGEKELTLSLVLSHEYLIYKTESISAKLTLYKGPCGIYTPIVKKCGEVGIEGISLWVGIPYTEYAILNKLGIVDWRATYLLVSSLFKLLNIEIDISDLKEKSLNTYKTLTTQYTASRKFDEYSRYTI